MKQKTTMEIAKLVEECHELEEWFNSYLEEEKKKKKEQVNERRTQYRNIPKSADGN